MPLHEGVWGIDPDTKQIAIAEDSPSWLQIHAVGRTAEDRIRELYDEFDDAVGMYEPGYVYVEKPMYTGNPVSTIAQVMVVGVIRAVLWRHEVPHSLVDPGVWKKALLGTGRASKEEIKDFIRARSDLPEDLDQDVYDALAIATWGSSQFKGNTVEKPQKRSRAA